MDALPLLSTDQMASFVARGFLRLDAVVPDDVNAQAMDELPTLLRTWVDEFRGITGTRDDGEAPLPRSGTVLADAYAADSAFGRMVRVYVREQHRLTLAQAVHKMSGQSAAQLGLRQRGLIRPGYKADLVLFDPDRFADKATVAQPGALAVGMATVIVGGQIVYRHGKPTGAYPGQFLKRGQD